MCLNYVRMRIRHIQSTIRNMVLCLAKQDAFVNIYSKAYHIDNIDFKQDELQIVSHNYYRRTILSCLTL